MNNDIKDVIELAYQMRKNWGKDLDETLQDSDDVKELIRRQKEYDDYIHELAENKHVLSALNDIIIRDKEEERGDLKVRKIKKIAGHIALVSKNKNIIDITERFVLLRIQDSLHLCSKEVITFWLDDLLENTKKYAFDFLSDYAYFIASNAYYNQYTHHFLNKDETALLKESYGMELMLAYTEHPKAKEILLKELKNPETKDPNLAAEALMILGEEAGLQYFRKLSQSGEYYQDMGRELALFGNKADVRLVTDLYDRDTDDTDILIKSYLNGAKDLIAYYFNIIISSDNNDAREISHESLVTLFLPEDSYVEYMDLLETESWEDIIQIWQTWIDKHYKNLPSQRYYEYGKPFRIKKTLEEVKRNFADPIGFSRWNRLAIYTGKILPYDPLAYYEKQLTQIKAMEGWIDVHSEQFPDGRWYRFGKDVTDIPTPL